MFTFRAAAVVEASRHRRCHHQKPNLPPSVLTHAAPSCHRRSFAVRPPMIQVDATGARGHRHLRSSLDPSSDLASADLRRQRLPRCRLSRIRRHRRHLLFPSPPLLQDLKSVGNGDALMANGRLLSKKRVEGTGYKGLGIGLGD
ncbi:hypothetical protein LINPERHAP1_LOCUS19116 [Linum perenne]